MNPGKVRMPLRVGQPCGSIYDRRQKSTYAGKWLQVKTKCRSPSVSWTVQKSGVSYSISD